MSSFCLGCGMGLEEGQRICGHCGRDSAATTPVAHVDPQVAFGLRPETSAKAIFSLICGLICFFPPASIVAIVFGHLSLSDIRKGGGRWTGKGLAITGLVLGYLSFALWAVFFGFAISTIPKTMRAMKSINGNVSTVSTVSTVSAIRTLNTAEIAYAQAHRSEGYTCSLSDLSKAWGLPPGLAQGRRSGYTFEVQNCSPGTPNGPVTKYQIVAYPSATSKGLPAYCSREDAVVKIARSGSAEDCLREGQNALVTQVNR